MKKNILLFTFLLLNISLDGCTSINEEKDIKITVNINDDIAHTSQWVYWFSLIGNDYNIEDSLLLHKGQKEFTFKKIIGKDRGFYFTWLTFEKEGPTQTIILAIPGEELDLTIKSNINNDAKIEGSLFYNEDYVNKLLIKELKDSLYILQDSLTFVAEHKRLKNLEYRREKIERYIKSERYVDFLLKAKSPITAVFNYDVLPIRCPTANLDSLKQVIVERFANDKIVDQYLNYKKFPPETKRSKEIYLKYEQLAGISQPSQENPRQDLKNIKAYSINQKVDSVSLKGMAGSKISLDDIKTEYILIDFWASWCSPCRREIPHLKKVANKYSDLITIYSISLDDSENEWKNAIKIDKIEAFIHVYADTSTESAVLKARFGVNAIPANFLLDKNRKIIAVNLREDALMKKMDELFSD